MKKFNSLLARNSPLEKSCRTKQSSSGNGYKVFLLDALLIQETEWRRFSFHVTLWLNKIIRHESSFNWILMKEKTLNFRFFFLKEKVRTADSSWSRKQILEAFSQSVSHCPSWGEEDVLFLFFLFFFWITSIDTQIEMKTSISLFLFSESYFSSMEEENVSRY